MLINERTYSVIGNVTLPSVYHITDLYFVLFILDIYLFTTNSKSIITNSDVCFPPSSKGRLSVHDLFKRSELSHLR